MAKLRALLQHKEERLTSSYSSENDYIVIKTKQYLHAAMVNESIHILNISAKIVTTADAVA